MKKKYKFFIEVNDSNAYWASVCSCGDMLSILSRHKKNEKIKFNIVCIYKDLYYLDIENEKVSRYEDKNGKKVIASCCVDNNFIKKVIKEISTRKMELE